MRSYVASFLRSFIRLFVRTSFVGIRSPLNSNFPILHFNLFDSVVVLKNV